MVSIVFIDSVVSIDSIVSIVTIVSIISIASITSTIPTSLILLPLPKSFRRFVKFIG